MHIGKFKATLGMHLVILLFLSINTNSGIKISRKKAQRPLTQRNLGNFSNPFGNQNAVANIEKHQENAQVIISDAMETLQKFENTLDSISNIISQKVAKMTPPQARHAEEYVQQVSEMRSILFESREKILAQKPGSLQQLRILLSNIGSLLSIVVPFARSLDYSINNKFKKVKQFDIVSTMKRSKQRDQAKFIAQYMFEIQDCVASIEKALNDFDITSVNKFFQSINTNILNTFYKYHLNSILYYGALWGIPASLLLWQWGGSIANANEFKYLTDKDNKVLGQFNLEPAARERQLPPAEYIFMAEGKEIYKTIHPIELGKNFKDSQGLLMRGWYKFCIKWCGLPSNYFSAPDDIEPNKGAEYAYKKRMLLGNAHKARIIGTIDDTLSGYFSNKYPLVTMAVPMLAPTIQKTWSESIYPFIYGNVSALWNKLMGGIFENRSIEGMFELMISDFTLDDVIGMENEKELLNILIDYLMNPVAFTQRHGNKIDKAFVFTGPTRTGKTYLFKAFVGSLQKKLRLHGRSLRSVRAYEFPVHLVQQAGITQIMNYMKTMAPAVFFIDEIDLVKLQRTTDSTVLADFLTGLGNALNDDPSRPIILFCATNKIQNLDVALTTKGRLGEEIPFDYPSYSHRKEFLTKVFKKLGLDKLKIDIDALVQQLGGEAYETMNYILHAAMMQASVAGQPFTQEHFENAIDRSVRRIMNANRKDLVHEEQLILAAHFAGHIVAFLLLQLHEILHKVTIKAVAPRLKEETVHADLYQKEEQKQKKIVFGAIFVAANGDSDKLATREMLISKIKRLLAGYIAEELLVGSCGYTCHPEYKEEAYNIALSIMLSGVKFDSLPGTLKAEFSKRAIALLDQYTEEMRALFKEHTALLQYMSDALLTHEKLALKQIESLYETFKQKQEDEREKTEILGQASEEGAASIT